MVKKTVNEWKGAFSLYQNTDFVKIFARHYQLNVLDLDGLLVMGKQFPLLGTMGCLLGCPEQTGTFQQWWARLDKLRFSHIIIQTNEKLDQLQDYCTSPIDNCSMVVLLPDIPERLLASFQKRKQRTIKKTESEKKITVAQIQDTDQLSALYTLCRQISQNGQLFPLPDFALIEDLWRSGFVTAFAALHDGIIIGGIFYQLSCDTMYGWIGGVAPDYLTLNVWDIMHYRIMIWGIVNGYQYYDMGDQSRTEQPNITSYKMRFRPELIPCFHYRVIRSKIKYLFSSLKKYMVDYNKS